LSGLNLDDLVIFRLYFFVVFCIENSNGTDIGGNWAGEFETNNLKNIWLLVIAPEFV